MSEGLRTTFEELSKTDNEAAASVLVSAIDSPYEAVREGALRAILARRSHTGQRELIRRLHVIDERWRSIINENRGRMTNALRDAILDSDPRMFANGCQGVLWFADYDLVPALVHAAEAESNPHAEAAAATLLNLVGLLYDELAQPRDYSNRRDPQLVRRNVTVSLEQSVKRFPKHQRKEVIESFLVLAGRDNATLKRILMDPFDGSYLAVLDAMTHSHRAGVMRLLISYLDDPQPPSAAIGSLAHRDDFKFVRHLLRKVADGRSDNTLHNLKRIESFVWLRDDYALVDRLDESSQRAAVHLAVASGMKRADVFRLIDHLMAGGKTKGRRAAALALAAFTGAEANALAMRALADDDPHVQAAVLSQIRNRGIPGALPKLIEMIDSPHEVIRDAAQGSLGEFSFRRFLAAYDMIDEEVRRSTGMLVKKIDPTTIPMLKEQLSSKSRTRRLRSLSLAATIDAVDELGDMIIGLLSDGDHLVRGEAARALAGGRSPAVIAALEEALDDSSTAVREAAAESLERIHMAHPPAAAESEPAARQEATDE